MRALAAQQRDSEMNRTQLTAEPDGSLTLICTELQAAWNFNSHHIA